MRLVLFDIDGTLLSCGPQVRPLFAAALNAVFGPVEAVEGYDFRGRTDSQIVLDLATGVGVPRERAVAEIPRVRRLFAEQLEQGLERERMVLLPGVVELLDRLARRRELTVGLLTGNWEVSGRIKLSRFGLNRHFPFGAFGDDGVERPELLPVALERAACRAGCEITAAQTLLIGDSVRDVACARAHGAAVLAVATGGTTPEELQAAGAQRVVPDLTSALEAVPELVG